MEEDKPGELTPASGTRNAGGSTTKEVKRG